MLLVAVLPMVVVLLLFLFFQSSPLSPEDPTKLAGSLEITSSKLRYVQGGNGHGWVSIVGMLRNNASEAVSDPHFAVRFLDARGDLIDGHSGSDPTLILSPGAEHAFAVHGRALQPEDAYASYEIDVTGASHAKTY